MPTLKVSYSRRLLTTCAEAARRHQWSGVKSRTKAIAQLTAQLPRTNPDHIRHLFALFCRIAARALKAVDRFKIRRKKYWKFAEVADIDVGACFADIDRIEPGFAVAQKKMILGWAVFNYLC